MAEAAGRLAALTGGTGFLGRHVAEALLARGWRVRALARPGRRLDPRAQAVAGDLDDVDALRRLVAGAEAVVHCAGLTQARHAADFARVNVAGTARLLECVAATAPAAHVVHVSSLAAREPHLSSYAASKQASEAEARRQVAAERLAIVRPPALYGPHDTQTLAAFKAARLPLCPLPGTGRERVALCHAADAAGAIADLAETRAPGRFSLADRRPDGYALREIFAAAAAAQGRRARFLKVPAPVLAGLGAASALVAAATRRPALLSPDKIREMRHADWSVDPAEMPPGLQAAARSIERGFTDTVAWYRQADWL